MDIQLLKKEYYNGRELLKNSIIVIHEDFAVLLLIDGFKHQCRLCVRSKNAIFFKARWGRTLQKGSSWKPPASLGVVGVSFVLTLVPDLSIILYLLGLSWGVLGCWEAPWPQSLLIWVSPVLLWLHLPSFLSLRTFSVRRPLECLLLRWLLFQGCASQHSKHSALSGAGAGSTVSKHQPSWEKYTFHNVTVTDFQLLQALQVTFPRPKWDYSVFVFLE